MTNEVETPVRKPEAPSTQDPKFGDFLKSILTPGQDDKTKDAKPPMYAVVLHNDNSTHPFFVVRVLQEAFGLSDRQARSVMDAAHRGSRCLVKVCSKEEADAQLATAKVLIAQADPVTDFFVPNTPNGVCELTFTSELETKGDGQ